MNKNAPFITAVYVYAENEILYPLSPAFAIFL